MTSDTKHYGHFQKVNNLNIYYELYETNHNNTLVLLHGGGSTIKSTFGRILPLLIKTHKIIAIELQAHGHTSDIDRPLSFEQDADDVFELLKILNFPKVNIMGFSNGGTTSLQIAIRHPEIVNKLILASTTFKRNGMQPEFWENMHNASIDNMPQSLKDAYLEANPDIKGLEAMFMRDLNRMIAFKDINEKDIKNIQAPTLVINGDTEVVMTEHALLLSHLLPHGHITILPAGHGEYIGEISATDKKSKMPVFVVDIIEEFLKI